MAFFYIKNGGIATTDAGRATVERTGIWNASTADYFDSKIAALATTGTAPINGDFFYFSDGHIEPYSAETTYIIPTGITCVSVDDTAQNIYKAGAEENTVAGTYSLIFNSTGDGKIFKSVGMKYLSGDDFKFNEQSSRYIFKDCYLQAGPSNGLFVTSGGAFIDIQGGELNLIALRNYFYVTSGATVKLNAVIINAALLQNIALFNIFGGGGSIEVSNTNLTGILDTDVPLVRIENISSDTGYALFKRCKIDPLFVFVTDSFLAPNIFIDAYSCDNGDGYHYFESIRFEGKVLESTAAGTRSDGATYNGTSHFSAEFQTNSNVVAYTQPLRYKLAELELDLTTSKQLTFHIMMQDTTAPTALNDHECWIEVVYPDATDLALGKIISSQTHDILETPVDLTLSNKSWDNTTGVLTKQLMSVTVPASIAKAPVTIYLHLAKDITTGSIEFFACPKPEIS